MGGQGHRPVLGMAGGAKNNNRGKTASDSVRKRVRHFFCVRLMANVAADSRAPNMVHAHLLAAVSNPSQQFDARILSARMSPDEFGLPR